MNSARSYVEAGTLPTPGPVGRLARLLFALLCAWFLLAIVLQGPAQVVAQFPRNDEIWPWAMVALYLFSYVINIGLGRSWGRWPQVAVILCALLTSAISRVITGSWFGPPLAWLLLVWLVYTYTHLGLSFLLSALAATPGCEMRAIPHLLAKLRGRNANEHHCPAGPLSRIDAWEQRRRTANKGDGGN